MQRLIAILLFAAFVLPLALPLFALGQNPDAGLPMCCRRNGKHHCAMNMGERMQMAAEESKTPNWRAPQERCPYAPAQVVSPHQSGIASPTTMNDSAVFFSQPQGVVQTESRCRLARDRSRQKRGPPTLSLA